MKEGSVGPPDIYLGAKLRKVALADGTHHWGQSSSHYIQEAIKNVENWTQKNGYHLLSKVDTPMSTSYRPELDVSQELDSDETSFFMSGIGVLRWIVELGRIDIATEASMLAGQMALPRKGHLFAMLRVFSYLKKKHNARLVFDATVPNIDMSCFPERNWHHFYGNVTEDIPSNGPKPRGKPVVLRMYVDSDHAGERLTRRSRTGYIIFINTAPIQWYSKKQGSVEASTFGSEFVAMKSAAEANRGLRYKLRMMGIPIEDPTYTFGDNQSVLNNTTTPESMLKKKSNAICYHFVQECCARGEMIATYINTKHNVADILTKVLPASERRTNLIRKLMWDI